jgi:hypothetical protein
VGRVWRQFLLTRLRRELGENAFAATREAGQRLTRTHARREAYDVASTLAGVVGMSHFTGAVAYALPISTGVTLYVAASDLIPEVNEQRGFAMALVVFLGVALFATADAVLEALGVS